MYICELIKQNRFIFTCEIISPKGTNIQDFLNTVDIIKDYVDAINIGDNQRAVMRAGSLSICHLLKSRNIETVMELTTRDRNRIALQSDLLGASILGIENLLLVTGHDPSVGDHTDAKPVYDLNCVSLLNTAKTLTKGTDIKGHALDGAPNFCLGITATPGLEPADKHLDELKEKIAQGAQFIQTDPVYDMEILEKFMESIKDLNIPVIVGHLMLKSASMASFMNSNVPGVTVPQKMIDELEGLPKGQLIDTSIEMSIDFLKKIKPLCQGIHLMPTGWERFVPRIVESIID